MINYRDQLRQELKKQSKKYKCKVINALFGFYINIDHYIFILHLYPKTAERGKAIYDIVLATKRRDVDDLYFRITDFKEEVHVTDRVRVNPGYCQSIIKKWTIPIILNEELYLDEDACEEIVRSLYEETTQFINQILERLNREHKNLDDYMIERIEEDPTTAGLVYVLNNDLENAKRCFQYAEDHNKAKGMFYGSFDRRLHHVMLDYCVCISNHEKWTWEKCYHK